MINITYKGEDYSVVEGTTAVDFIKSELKLDMEGIMACKISNEVKFLQSLNIYSIS